MNTRYRRASSSHWDQASIHHPISLDPIIMSVSSITTSMTPAFQSFHDWLKTNSPLNSPLSYTPWRVVWVWYRIYRKWLDWTWILSCVIIQKSFIILVFDGFLLRSLNLKVSTLWEQSWRATVLLLQFNDKGSTYNWTISMSQTALSSWSWYTKFSTQSMTDVFLVIFLPSLESSTDIDTCAWLIATSTTNFLFYTHLSMVKEVDEDSIMCEMNCGGFEDLWAIAAIDDWSSGIYGLQSSQLTTWTLFKIQRSLSIIFIHHESIILFEQIR